MNDDGKERARVAYETFRGGFGAEAPFPHPRWEEAPSWLRDVVWVAYLQGSLDAAVTAGHGGEK